MKKMLTVCALGLLPLCATTLLAEGAAPEADKNKLAGFTFSGNLALVTDYVSRGVSGSDHGPAMQGTFNANHDTGFYLGFFGTNVDFNDGGASLEMDLTAGYTKEWANGLSVDTGVIAYLYPNTLRGNDFDYREYFLGGGYKFDKATLKAKYFYSDAYFGETNGVENASASYLDGQLAYELPYKITLKGHVGRAFGDFIENLDRALPVAQRRGIDGYTDFSVGAATELAGFGMELNYIGMDSDGRHLNQLWNADGRVVFSLSRPF
ncbi:MAG: TorF family putative porin [Magnetococcus sp. MYC-9]